MLRGARYGGWGQIYGRSPMLCMIGVILINSLNFVLTVLWFELFQVFLVPKGRARLDCTSFLYDDFPH